MEIFSSVKLGPRVQVRFKGNGRTKQAMRDECDINKIMARYIKTGLIDHLGKHGEEYGFASSVSFHEAMNVVTKAEQMFEDLPADTRKRFEGDPGKFLDFVQDPENQEEMIALGLATRNPGSVRSAEPAAAAESAPITPEVAPPVEEPDAPSGAA